MAAREEVCPSERVSWSGTTGPPDCMQEHDAICRHQSGAGSKTRPEVWRPDMFEHADGNDAIKFPGIAFRKIAIVNGDRYSPPSE